MDRRTKRLIVGWAWLVAIAMTTGTTAAEAPKRLHDIMWVWGNPDMTKPGEHGVDAFVEASPLQRAKLLDVPNVIMAGPGLPEDDKAADAWAEPVAACPSLVWEISADGETHPPFAYKKRMAQFRRQLDKNPRIEALLLDDMSSLGIDKGFKPEHIRDIRTLLGNKHPEVKIWGVLYSMNAGRKGIEEYIKELDVINLWIWHAKDLPKLEKLVADCEKTYPGKPIVLGLYMHDYGDIKPMTQKEMELQCEVARRLAHAGRIQGIVFLSIDNNPEIVQWTADWIKRVGAEPIAKPQAATHRAVPVRLVAQETSAPAAAKPLELHLGDAADWHFVGGKGPWTETEATIYPPNEPNLHSRAFYTKNGFTDFTAEFDYRPTYRETGHGSAGLVFRAADANHGYFLNFPWGGQQLRAKHFWANLMKDEGDGYLRTIKAAWVPGVPSETERWYHVRVEVRGPRLRAWVDGVEALDATDTSFSTGAVGLAGYGWYSFRNVKISGDAAPLAAWDRKQTIPVNHFTVGLDSQEMPSGCIAPNGDVLLAAGHSLVRSTDKGRTWQAPETLPEKLGKVTDYGNTMFRTSKGRLIVQTWEDDRETKKTDRPKIAIAESTDNGRTWSDPVPSEVAAGWPSVPASLVPYGPILQTRDGTMLRFLLGAAKENSQFTNVVTWSAVHCKAFVTRSTDDGRHWSAAIELDRPGWYQQERGAIPGSLDLTEPTGVSIGNDLVVLVRPVYSPTMWLCRSNDDGATWDSAARATFPGYAQSMIRTHSGTIVCGHRYPQYSMNLSRDDGLNWDAGTVIDYPIWAMGCLIEVEPDVVLSTYMNWAREAPLLAQLIRVKPDRVEPIAVGSTK